MNEQLKKRVKSFSWRLGGMVFVAILAFAIEPETLNDLDASGVHIPQFAIVVVGLIVGEVTKHLNKGKTWETLPERE